MAIRSISCFAGCGGLDVAVELAIAGVEPVLYMENEIATAEILVARIKEGSLPKAHVWSDITTFDATQLRGKVDFVYGGFPCPDYSVAGKRAGIVGKHGQLWNSMRRIIREVGASWVFLENVPGILYGHPVTKWRAERDLFGRTVWTRYRMPAGLAFVLADLAEMGFDAEWGCLPAAAVGASHKRDRWFCLAYRPERGLGKLADAERKPGRSERQQKSWGPTRRRAATVDRPMPLDAGPAMADAESGIAQRRARERSEAWPSVGSGSDTVEHAERAGRRPHAESGGDPEPRQDGEGQAASGTGERSEPVGDTKCSRRPEAGSGHGVDAGREFEPGCCDLASRGSVAMEIGRRERGDGECKLSSTERSGGTVEHSDRDGCEEIGRRAEVESAAGSGRDADIGSAPMQSGAGLSIFAPGPSDPRWPDLLVRYPWLRPAISQEEIESDLCECPDGMVSMVVHERADALRAIGNGVVPLQAAAILRELIGRVGARIAT